MISAQKKNHRNIQTGGPVSTLDDNDLDYLENFVLLTKKVLFVLTQQLLRSVKECEQWSRDVELGEADSATC